MRLGAAAVAITVFAVVATANSGGYRYGASDQAFYLPAVVAELDPSSFPRDRELLDPQMSIWAGDSLIAGAARITGSDLPRLFLALYLATLVVLGVGGIRLAGSLGCGWATTGLFLIFMTLRHRIAKTGANTLEGYMHPRMLAFGCGLFVLAGIARERLWASAVMVVIATALHTPTGVWFGCVWLVAACWRWRSHRAVWLAAALAALGGSAAVVTLLGGHIVTMNAEWLEVLSTKDYLFSAEWPIYAWALNMAYPVVLVAIYRRRRALGMTSPGESALMVGLLALVVAFFVSLPFTQARIALAVQIQINRIFWLLDAVALLYLSWWIVSDVAGRSSARTRAAVITAAAALACGRGYFVLHVQAGRPLIEMRLPATPWNDAMAWLSQGPASWHVLADPQHAWKYGSSVRVAANRDTLLEASKDSALAMYDAHVAARVAERSRALADFDRFTTEDVRRVADRYDLDVFVERVDRPFSLPVLYRNGSFVVYDLRR